jgi:hypothetical protein
MTLDLDVAIIGAGLCGICPLRHAGVARLAARRRGLLRHGGAGSPNFFLMYGPNTNLGHNSIIFMIECQAAFILRCLRRLLDGAGSLEVEAEAMARYQARLEREIAGTVWARAAGAGTRPRPARSPTTGRAIRCNIGGARCGQGWATFAWHEIDAQRRDDGMVKSMIGPSGTTPLGLMLRWLP